jgi:hypothetical protein
MKYRFLIYDDYERTHFGTNDEKLALDFVEKGDCDVVDVLTGEHIGETKRFEIPEVKWAKL